MLADFKSSQWRNEPGTLDGSWKLSEDSQVLDICPDSKLDYWRKTYYQPLLIKDDGPVFVTNIPLSEDEWTATTTMHLKAVKQFDQGGLFVRLDFEHWIKAGFEFVGMLLLL